MSVGGAISGILKTAVLGFGMVGGTITGTIGGIMHLAANNVEAQGMEQFSQTEEYKEAYQIDANYKAYLRQGLEGNEQLFINKIISEEEYIKYKEEINKELNETDEEFLKRKYKLSEEFESFVEETSRLDAFGFGLSVFGCLILIGKLVGTIVKMTNYGLSAGTANGEILKALRYTVDDVTLEIKDAKENKQREQQKKRDDLLNSFKKDEEVLTDIKEDI